MLYFETKNAVKRAVLTALTIVAIMQASAFAHSLEGTVVNTDNQPLAGVSVVLMDSSRMLTCTATNRTGHFEINLAEDWPDSLALRISSVGYQRRDIMMVDHSTSEKLTITLRPAVSSSTKSDR